MLGGYQMEGYFQVGSRWRFLLKVKTSSTRFDKVSYGFSFDAYLGYKGPLDLIFKLVEVI